ncbi:hypothetical protein [Okeania sp. SIO2C2]|nr:hypothetical protein [Okeania sp. SIO2C2]
MTESSGVVGAIRESPLQELGGNTEVGRRRIGVEGESFFITLLSGHDIRS